MEHHMRQLEDQMKDIQEELVDEFKLKHAIQQDVESKDAKIKMLFHEVKSLRQNALKKEYAMSEMTREFTRIAQITNPKDLEIAVKDAYRTFVFGEAVRKKPNAKALLASFNQHLEENISPTSTSPSPQKKNSTVKTTAAPSTSSNTSINKISQVKANQKSNVGPTSSGGSQSQTQRPSTSAAATIGYDCKEAVNESVKQMEFMSKTIATLKTALENTQAKADRIRRDSVAEGSFLIEECNKLRKENKNLVMKLKELENLLSSGNAAACAAAAAALNSEPEGCHSPQRNISTTSNGKRNVLAASGSCPQMLTVSVDQEPPASTNSFVSPFKLRPIRVSSTSNKKQLHVSPVKIIQANNNSFPLARLEADRSKTAANGGINLNINFSDSEDSHH
jgi:predicted nuclease with TOPRIM domain